MPTLRPYSRENPPPRIVTFDDQLWPVNVAITILASFAAGVIITLSRFDQPDWLLNAWTHLGALATAALLMMWLASKLDRRRIRRGLQLATLLSLIVHLLLMTVLHNQQIDWLADNWPGLPRTAAVPEEYVVNYPVRPTDVSAESRQQPASAASPDGRVSTLARQEAQSLVPSSAPPAASLPDSTPQVQPRPLIPREREGNSPRIADPVSLLSKNGARQIEPIDATAPPIPVEDVEDTNSELQPPPLAIARRPAEAAAKHAPSSAEPAAIAEVTVGPPLTKLPRAERSDNDPDRPASPSVSSLAGAGASRKSSAIPVPVAPTPIEPERGTTEDVTAAGPKLDAAFGSRGKVTESVPSPTTTSGEAEATGIGPSAVRGLPTRRTPTDIPLATAETPRLLGRTSSGVPKIDGRSREPAEAYLRRNGQRQGQSEQHSVSTKRTEAAIELGLDFLVRHQTADGSWKLNYALAGRPGSQERASFRSDSAATGLALLSFLGAGYDHYGGPHALVIQRALDFLVKSQKPNGDLYQPLDAQSNQSAWLYSHGIAAIALCEAYGMTGDSTLAGPAQRAIDFIVASQDPQRGAWRYTPQAGSDTSVSGWQLMALKSGELAGLQVPQATYEKTTRWLDRAQVGSEYSYNPAAPNTPAQRHGRNPTSSMTAVALLMRLYTGWNRNDAQMVEGAENLYLHLPRQGTVAQAARDTYYWYYATQVMFHMRGKYWSAWHERLHPLLVDQQVRDGALAGSWDPLQPVPDRWGAQGGRLYVTTLNLLSLEVNYRHLPIYESTAK